MISSPVNFEINRVQGDRVMGLGPRSKGCVVGNGGIRPESCRNVVLSQAYLSAIAKTKSGKGDLKLPKATLELAWVRRIAPCVHHPDASAAHQPRANLRGKVGTLVHREWGQESGVDRTFRWSGRMNQRGHDDTFCSLAVATYPDARVGFDAPVEGGCRDVVRH